MLEVCIVGIIFLDFYFFLVSPFLYCNIQFSYFLASYDGAARRCCGYVPLSFLFFLGSWVLCSNVPMFVSRRPQMLCFL